MTQTSWPQGHISVNSCVLSAVSITVIGYRLSWQISHLHLHLHLHLTFTSKLKMKEASISENTVITLKTTRCINPNLIFIPLNVWITEFNSRHCKKSPPQKKRPDRLWGPYNHQFNGYQFYCLGVKATGAWRPQIFQNAEVKNEWRYSSAAPYTPSCRWQGRLCLSLSLIGKQGDNQHTCGAWMQRAGMTADCSVRETESGSGWENRQGR
jgi:hypothetical protein